MRHVVNVGLVLTFLALAVTGVMAFVLPFSITTTRVHIVAGLTTSILVGLHVFGRIPYFKRQLDKETARISHGTVLGMVLVWGGIVATAIIALPPSTWLINTGYEARNQAQIVRESPLVGYGEPGPHSMVVTRETQDDRSHELSLYLSFDEQLQTLPAVAVWAETTAGTMIETLHLPEELSYADNLKWQGMLTQRNHILPVWRNRFTALSGIDGDGNVDGTTGATSSHAFALDKYLVPDEDQKFVICVEINAAADPNTAYTDPELGQPSLLYTAYIKLDSSERHVILELTAHGGGAETNGNLQYDLDDITTAKTLADLLLLRINGR